MNNLLLPVLATCCGLLACSASRFTGAQPPLPVAAQSEKVSPPLSRAAQLGQVKSWGIHLTQYPQGLKPLTTAPFDLVVVDATDDFGTPWPKTQVQAASQNKLLISYLSVGAAESYRPYWQPGWKTNPPAWLLKEDPEWPGSFDVAYWNADWQQTALGQLDKVIASGFQGVYLDLVDAYQRHPERASARSDMVDWVCKIAAYARAKNPEFLIIPQNASALIRTPKFAACVDALGQEETFVYAMNKPTEAERQQELLQDYPLWIAAKKPILDIEYADQPALMKQTAARARALGLIPYLAGRSLNTLDTAQP